MNILYLHGFLGHFDPESEKIKTLSELGNVFGPNIDYTKHPDAITKELMGLALQTQPDLIAGTSMGGFFAARIGARAGIPFAAANPCIEPKMTLQQYTQASSPLLLQQEFLDAYPDFSTNGCGLILLDEGDEVIDAKRTSELIDSHYRVVTFPGGNHRFTHMKESLAHVKTMLDNAELVYGLDEE